MFNSQNILNKYNKQFKTSITLDDFNLEAFFNIINLSLIKITDAIDKQNEINLLPYSQYYFFERTQWTKIKKTIVKYHKKMNLNIVDPQDTLEYQINYIYKLKNKTTVQYIQNMFMYFVCGLFAIETFCDEGSELIIQWSNHINLMQTIHKLDRILSLSISNDLNQLISYYLNWISFYLLQLTSGTIELNIKSYLMINHNHNKEQEISLNNHNNKDDKEPAKIEPIKLTYEKLVDFKKYLEGKIIGQPAMIEKLNEILIGEMYNIARKNHRPIGVLFFVGPTGVGKTETVKELAKYLYGTEQIHRFDMSEYKSEVAIQKLIGAPNGYVGYQEGGTLTNAMQKNPNTIVLFDEIEKADKSVFDLFLQLIDDGVVTSNKGIKSFFDNTIVVFTSNLGVSNISPRMGYENIKEIVVENVEYFFNRTINRPELLGRIGRDNIVVFNLIHEKNDLYKILDIQFKDFLQEYKKHHIIFSFNKNEVYDEILNHIDITKGARDIRNKVDLFKKHLFSAFFEKQLSIDDMKNKTIKIKYENQKVKIISIQ